MTPRRIAMARHLESLPPTGEWSCRTVNPSDKQDLGILLYAAYRGTIDDEGEPATEAAREIAKVFAGDYGAFLPGCSFLIENDGFVLSACLVTWFDLHHAPLVVFAMTRPEHKNRGMARQLLVRSMNALFDRGYERVTLVVTEGNLAAQHLYTSMGFVPFT